MVLVGTFIGGNEESLFLKVGSKLDVLACWYSCFIFAKWLQRKNLLMVKNRNSQEPLLPRLCQLNHLTHRKTRALIQL